MVQNIILQKSGHPINPVTGNKINLSDTPLANLDINKIFGSEVGNDADIVKELFNPADIEIKTELTDKEVKLISKLDLAAAITNSTQLKFILNKLQLHKVSKNRMSRTEVVQAIGGLKNMETGGSFMNNLGNIFKRDKN